MDCGLAPLTEGIITSETLLESGNPSDVSDWLLQSIYESKPGRNLRVHDTSTLARVKNSQSAHVQSI